MIEIILTVVIAAAVIAAIVVIVRKKKSGKGCSCGCEGCSMPCRYKK
ncbi:MAG: FeoB-associated Cys-rich membrane protein [Ruminococcus sp.]|nr:FeoB-associated Cys-rich membrane protein [Ruminococcus sp.]